MDPSEIELPASLIRNALNLPTGRAWLATWRNTVREHLARWELRIDLPHRGTPWAGHCAVAVPVRTRAGLRAVLKVTIPHDEALPEPDALRLWEGFGAVAVLDSNRQSFVLLLERLDGGRSLMDTPLEETAELWGQLVRRLALPPGSGGLWQDIPSVAEQAEQWTDTMPADWERFGRPFDRWLLEYALEVCQVHGTVGRRADRDVLVHADLHYENIVPRLGRPTEFVAIDPKPVVGDAEFAVAPMLWNRIGELSPADPAAHLRERCSDLAFAAGLDPQRSGHTR